MKRRSLNLLGVVMAVFALLVASAAPVSAKNLALNAEVAGDLQITGFGPNGPTSAHYWGGGVETSLGDVTMDGLITITGPASCPGGFTATHIDVLTAANGDSVTVEIAETSCPTPGPGPNLYIFDCEGTFKIIDGTGEFKYKKGSGKWEGTLLLDMGTGLGTFNAEYSQ